MDDLDDLLETGDRDWRAWAKPPRTRCSKPVRHALAVARLRYWKALARLRKVRPLPAEPLGEIVFGEVRFPIREPIVLRDGEVHFTGTAFSPFRKRLPVDVVRYQIVGPDGLVVHEGPVHPDLYSIVTTSAMTLSYTARIQLRRGGP